MTASFKRPNSFQVTPSKYARNSPQYREEFLAYLRGDAQLRDLSVISGPDGAYALRPETPSQAFFGPPSLVGGLRSRIDLVKVTGQTGERGVKVSNRSVTWVNGDSFDLDTDVETVITFAERRLSLNAKTGFLRVDFPWLFANIFSDPLGWLNKQFDLAWQKESERLILYATGNSEPLGILTPSSQGIPATQHIDEGGAGGVLTLAQLINIFYAVPVEHRSLATWNFATDAMIQIDSLRDSGGAPILSDYFPNGTRMLMGRPCFEVPQIAPTTTDGAFADGALVGFFGNLQTVRAIETEVAIKASSERLIERNETLVQSLNYIDAMPASGGGIAVAKIKS
jgi:HK97 family phage major capsid protein